MIEDDQPRPRWYLVDEVKGSCYEHRHELRKLDFDFDKDTRKWFSTMPVPGEVAEQLARMGIAVEI